MSVSGKLVLRIVMLGLGLSLSVAAPAFAYGPNAATVTSNTSSIGSGGSLTVTGSNFVPGETITLDLHSTPVMLDTTAADGTGAFTATVTIPSDAPPGAHTIVATGASGDAASTAITLVSSISTTGATPALAFTGADIAAVSAVGAVALALGGMLVLTGRGRRTAA